MQDWYAFYGLDRDPFAEGGMYGLFYPGGARQETVEQLLHLARFSDSALLVCGAPGAGKSAILRHFVAQSASDTRYCVIDAALLDTPERLLGRILDGFGIASSARASLEDGLGRLEEFAHAGHASGLLSWILIDDAQHLHADALQLLPRILDIAGSKLRLILFAEPQWQQTLKDALPENGRLHTLELAPFDRGESYAYIHYRLKTAGLEAEPPFNAGEFEEIHRQSGGLPGRINVLARKVLTDAVVEVEQPLSTLPLWHFGVVGATLLALLLLYVWGSLDQKSPARPVPQANVAQATPEERSELITIETGNGEPGSDAPAVVRAEAELADGATGSLPGDDIAGDAMDADVAEQTPVEATPATRQPAQTPALEKAPPEPAAAAAAAKSPVPALREKNFVYRGGTRAGGELSDDEQFLLGLEGSRYVLQIMGSDDAAKVRAFAARQGLPLRQFRKLHNGTEWYALVQGNYPDRASAERALEELPESLRKARPWVRRADAIQEEIRQALIP